jgi:hypothetical protein
MTPDPRVKVIGEITTRHLFDMVVDLNPRLEIGTGPLGRRILFGSALVDGGIAYKITQVV